jgi:hypothetical protein
LSADALQQMKPEKLAPAAPGAAARGAMIAAATLGDAWLDVARLILARGADSSYEGLPLLELELVTLDIAAPDPDDRLMPRMRARIGWPGCARISRIIRAWRNWAAPYASRSNWGARRRCKSHARKVACLLVEARHQRSHVAVRRPLRQVKRR